jgi:cobalamin biosynthesis protein CobW
VQAFQWPEIRNACTVDAVITVVDSPAVAAGTFAAYPDQVDAQRKLDPNLDHESPLHELFADQLASADLVVLNKADLIDAEGLAKVRAEVAEELPPAVKVIEASSGRLPLDVLLGVGAESEAHIDGRRTHHDRTTTAMTTTITTTTPSTRSPSTCRGRRKPAARRPDATGGGVRHPARQGLRRHPGKPMRLLIQGVGTLRQALRPRLAQTSRASPAWC